MRNLATTAAGLSLAAVLVWPQIAGATSVDAVISGIAGEYSNAATHTFVRSVKAPTLGDHIVYLESRDGGPEARVAQQSLLMFGADSAGVYADPYDIPDGAKYIRADAIPERLQPLTRDDLTSSSPNCRLRWSETKGVFTGKAASSACRSDREYRFSRDGVTFRQQTADVRQKRLVATNLDAQLDRIFSAMQGAFENRPILSSDTKGAQEIASLFTLIRRADVPAFGSRVLYMEFRRGGVDGAVELQRLVNFDDNPTRAANVMRSYNFRQGQAYVGASIDPSKLAKLTREEVEQLPVGCEHIWQNQNGVLIGSVTRDTCHIYVPSIKQSRHVSLEYMLDGASLRMWEQGFDPEGRFRFGTATTVRFPRVKAAWE